MAKPTLDLPASELNFTFSRSSGPGGQHVNKTETKVEVTFDIAASSVFSEGDKEYLLTKLSNRIDTEGFLHVTSESERSQTRNRAEAVAKLIELLQTALVRPKKRKRTKPSRSVIQRRLDTKKKQADKKKNRRTDY